MAGMFSGVSKTEISRGYGERVYFEPNDYIVEISECKMIESDGKKALIIEAEILTKKRDTGIKPNLGDKAAYFISMKPGKKETSIWHNNLMSFMCSVYECEPDEYDDDMWEEMIEGAFEGNNLKGEVLKLTTNMNEAGTYTRHYWNGEPSEKDWDDYELVVEED